MEKQSLRTAYIVANMAAYQSLGTQIPANMRRMVYKIKATNLFAGPNILSVARGPAAAEVVIDTIQATLIQDIWNDPDEISESSAPLYIFEAANQFIRVIASAGNMTVFIIYADEP